MGEESENWWEQALEDLDTSKYNLKGGKYYASVFFARQSAEKVFKALYIEKNRELPQRTHNMLKLAEKIGVPDEIFDAVIELNPEYFMTRYLDAANGVPAKMYTEEIAKVHLEKAEIVIEWIKLRMKL